DVCCVIVAYHRPDQLTRLLQQLSHPRLEIIVVNVEADPRVSALGGVEFVSTRTNIGYAAAVNVGAARAHSDVIAFMNDDIDTTAAEVLRLSERVRTGCTDVALPLVENREGRLDLGARVPLRLAERMLLQGMRVPTGPVRVDAAWAVLVAARTDVL